MLEWGDIIARVVVTVVVIMTHDVAGVVLIVYVDVQVALVQLFVFVFLPSMVVVIAVIGICYCTCIDCVSSCGSCYCQANVSVDARISNVSIVLVNQVVVVVDLIDF